MAKISVTGRNTVSRTNEKGKSRTPRTLAVLELELLIICPSCRTPP